MKKIALLLVSFALVLFISSCADCKECKIVTYAADGTTPESEVDQGEYCDEDLAEVDGTSDTDPQGIKTEWVCE